MRPAILLFAAVVLVVLLIWRRSLRTASLTRHAAPSTPMPLRLIPVQSTSSRVFIDLAALVRELDLNLMALRRHLHATAAALMQNLSAEQVMLIENRLSCKLYTGPSNQNLPLQILVDKLESSISDCQLIAALLEHFLAKPTVCAATRRPLVIDAKNDLALATRWLETASLILRVVPMEQRFSRVRFLR